LGIYIGFVHFGLLGATLVIIAFVLPAFLMVLLLGMAYKVFNGLPWMQALFYGIGAAVIGIITVSSYKLTTRSIGKFNLQSFRQKWMLWLFFAIIFTMTVIWQNEGLLLFIGAGLIYMAVKAPPACIKRPPVQSILLLTGTGFWDFNTHTLIQMTWFFTKAGAFVFGSGLAIIPFLHGAVTDYHWIDEHTFLDAVAVAMITPGPVVITVAFIGYMAAVFLVHL